MSDAIQILVGDCRERLRELPEKSVQTCVTSPPFFGLRDYGTGKWEGGDSACDHLGASHRTQAGFNERYFGREKTEEQGELREPFRSKCGKCGARRIDQQIGLEPTPDEFVAALVCVFRDVRRVLRDDATVWLNLGDSYAHTSPQPDRSSASSLSRWADGGRRDLSATAGAPTRGMGDAKPKDLLGIPWMVAFALRADGWYLRSEIIWAKPNPMPESVTDRPTKSHETIFLLSKGPTYFYDADAVREDVAPSQVGRVRADPIGGKSWQGRQQHSAGAVYRTGGSAGGFGNGDGQHVGLAGDASEGAPAELVSDERADGFEPSLGVFGVSGADLNGQDDVGGEAGEGVSAHTDIIPPAVSNASGRNKRSVWTVVTQPYPGAHFATFPPKLIEPCILAGSSPKACGKCGAPWRRVVEATKTEPDKTQRSTAHYDTADRYGAGNGGNGGFDRLAAKMRAGEHGMRTVGWEASCTHRDDTGKSVVLDPFAGSGTTGAVALEHGRAFVGIELNPKYADLIRERLLGAALRLEGFGTA